MRYVTSKIRQEEMMLSYRIYISDSLFYAPQQMHLSTRWIESLERKATDNRTGNEIAFDIIKRLNLGIEKDECI